MQIFSTFTGSNFADVLRRWSLVLAMIASVAGCGGATVDSSPARTSATTTSTAAAAGTELATDVSLSGSVGDGPVTGAKVKVYSKGGSLLGTMVTDSTASFNVTVKARGRDYPLRLVVSGGTDLVTGLAPDFTLVSLLERPSDKQANINPFTTFIVGLAAALPGGLSSTNVSTAQGIVQQQLGFGLDPALVPDPFTTSINKNNVASLVKASEALGELVRRTRDLSGVGANAVVAALVADLTDGYLDGLGATGTNARLSAVANVASSQVLVETLSNSLRVGGVIARGVMDQSIRSTRPGIAGSQLTNGVRITAQLLEQSRVAMGAAQVLDNSSAVQDIANRVDGLSPNSTAASVSSVLPIDSTNTLRTAVLLASGASRAEISAINQLVFAYSDSSTTGSTTTTTSTTTGSGTTGTTTTTSGTTTSGTTGTTGGTTTTSTSTVGSFTLSWTAPTTRSDGSPISLAEIGGYRIYYGKARGSYSSQVTVSSGTAQSTTVGNLSAGTTYHLVMTTYDDAGLESGYSPDVVKTAQ